MSKRRKAILDDNYADIQDVYLQTRENGIACPVVFVLDPDDYTAASIIKKQLGGSRSTRSLQQGECYLTAIDRRQAREFFISSKMRFGAEFIRSVPPEDSFFVVVVTDNGISYDLCKTP